MDTTAPTTPVLWGFRGPDACAHAGISYRQLDYWARTGLVVPSVRGARGSGSQRLYSRVDVIDLALVKTLLDAGFSLQLVRAILPQVRADRGGPHVVPAPLTFRGTTDVVTITIDVERLASRIPNPPQEHGPSLAVVPPPGLRLTP